MALAHGQAVERSGAAPDNLVLMNCARMSRVANASGTGQTTPHAERSLIEALRQGDEAAFARLVAA